MITRKLFSIEDLGQTDHVLTLTCHLRFQSMRAMVVTHTRAKDQGQRSVGSKDRVEMDGWTERQMDGQTDDGGDCITSRANGKHFCCIYVTGSSL